MKKFFSTYPLLLFLMVCCQELFGQKTMVFSSIELDKKGELQSIPNEKGDEVPDFSYAGYQAGEKPIPDVPVRVFIPHTNEDATQIIQAALDKVAVLEADEHGIRGAVLLDKGVFHIAGNLLLRHSGVILRGSGIGESGTVLLGTGNSRNTLIRIEGINDRDFIHEAEVMDNYVPVNAKRINVIGAEGFSIGQTILVYRPSIQAWIDELKMKEFGGETGWLGWKPGDHDQYWDRRIVAIEGTIVELDAPITTALDKEYGNAKVMAYQWPGRIEQVGVENLTLRSEYDPDNPKDEAHRWMAISMGNVQNAWVRQVDFEHFAGSAVAIWKSAKLVTVEDCRSLNPVSEIGAQRRYTFYTQGQQTLFQRCSSEFGYHDFAVGLNAAGPNAFVECEAYLPYSSSGGIEGWASGALFDNVKIEGHALSFNNLGQNHRGAGWTIANSMIWQCAASMIECYAPPTAQNWAYGNWGQFAGDAFWDKTNNHIQPRSLYYAQLKGRLGKLPADPFLLPLDTEASTSPSQEQARELTVLARDGIPTLKEWIVKAGQRNPVPIDPSGIPVFAEKQVTEYKNTLKPNRNTRIEEGRLIHKGRLLTGKRQEVSWWRGSLREKDVYDAKAHVTRFVPGRIGKGYTDDLEIMTEDMLASGSVVLDHNYGLWYDRRRDDHERVRRMDGEVWAPFYEQPFARSGEGMAWDGLSKYDLTKFNTWYWDRLKKFAELGEDKGLVLIHHNYFQHNILEAGAHWADSPWRPANNVNDTGFPEPPPYAGDKRIFLDEQFYDISHPVRRELHERYIRQCLENFANQGNVIQMTSAEYTGPLHFVAFWLDVIREWESETGKTALTGLSTTKDVQDSVLNDPKRASLVDIIDIRYWHYREDGSLYSPEGGKHLAPRQHARQMKTGKETAGQVFRAVREYKERFPDKAVIYSANGGARFGWAVLFAGGSLPDIPEVKLEGFAPALARMQARTSSQDFGGMWEMSEPGISYLFYSKKDQGMEVDLKDYPEVFELYRINPENGQVWKRDILDGGQVLMIETPEEKNCVVWVKHIGHAKDL